MNDLYSDRIRLTLAPPGGEEITEYRVILEAWLANQSRMLDYIGAGHPGAANALAAYMTVGDDPSNAMAQILSRFLQLYPNPGVPIHTFTHLSQYLALDADPDGDGYTNLQEWEYIELYEVSPVAASQRTRGAARREVFTLA